MSSLSAHSRRALVAATAALTAAPVAAKKKKGKKNKKPAPLAYAVVADTSVVVLGHDFIRVSYRAALYFPSAAGLATIMNAEADVVFADGIASFIAEVQADAAARFAEAGDPVSADRIAVTVL